MKVYVVTTGSGIDGDEVALQAIFSSAEKADRCVDRLKAKRCSDLDWTEWEVDEEEDDDRA